MRRHLGTLAVVIVATAAAAASAQGPPAVSDLIAAQTRLVERTREYRATLVALLALDEDEARRLGIEAARRRDLVSRGLIARREAEESAARAARARAKVEETGRRIAEADALVSETLAAIEVAKTPRAAQAELVATSTVIRFRGIGALHDADIGRLQAFFSERFGRALPISALGQTAVHDRLGLDHRHALDVAVHPDTDEGAALIAYLERQRIPFLAFRGAVPGASTGAHVHVGQLSPRLLPAAASR